MSERYPVVKLILCCFVFLAMSSVSADEAAEAIPTAKTSSLTLAGAPLDSSIRALCDSFGVQYRIGNDVSGGSVTLSFEGDTLDQALSKLSNSTGVTYTVENGTYCFSLPGVTADDSGANGASQQAVVEIKEGIYRGDFQRSGVYSTKGVSEIMGAERILGVDTNEMVQCSPVLASGVLYVCLRDRTLRAVDAATGKEIWRYQAQGTLWSPPAIVEGVVYLPSRDKYIYAIDAKSGTLNWKFRAVESVGSSPALWKGVVYFGDTKGRLYALDALTGARKWELETKCKDLGSPALDSETLYIGGDDALIAVDVNTYQEKWRWDGRNAVICETPVVAGNMVLFVAQRTRPIRPLDERKDDRRLLVPGTPSEGWSRIDGRLHAVDARAGTERWQLATDHYPTRDFIGSPAVENGVVYCTTLDGIYAVNLTDGQVKWHYKADTPQLTAPKYLPRLRYIADNLMSRRRTDASGVFPFSLTIADGLVYCGDSEGYIYAVNAQTGQEKWKHKAEGVVYTSPVIANGRIYFATLNVSGLQVLR